VNYEAFIAGKHIRAESHGFEPSLEINTQLFPFQREIVATALRRGRCAVFAAPGLGKTAMQLEWARHVASETKLPVLIIAPLAVALQTRTEGEKFGHIVTVCQSDDDVRAGINVTNYDRLDKFDLTRFAGVALDESSILKSYMGKTKRALIERCVEIPYRTCWTATPAPNDHMEIGNHSEFLGVMPSPEMLTRWFINDTSQMGTYVLKGHAVRDFWQWVASWAVSLRKPSDLGEYDDAGYDLPALRVETVSVPVDIVDGRGDALFREPTLSATEMHRELKRTAPARAKAVAEIVAREPAEQWLVWCNTNEEADALTAAIPDAVEVRGTDSREVKESRSMAFARGELRVLVSKPSIFGMGLNFQSCARVAFVGLSYSFEQFYQALCRTHRFGQTREVHTYVVGATTEGAIGAAVERKARDYEAMMDAMVKYAREARVANALTTKATIEERTGNGWTMRHGDCVIGLRETVADDSVDFCVHSPPFSNLYIYSDSQQDMGNSRDDAEFFEHYDYCIRELFRVMRPGRLVAVHCKQLVNYSGRDGRAGLRDFRGDIIRAYERAGFQFHSEVTIWTDPVIEMQRTKAHGLLYKQIRADSSFSRQGLAEYLVIMRKWAMNDNDAAKVVPVTHTKESFPLETWQRYASPVWMDIKRTNVLNTELAREDRDQKHICPLQLDVIERAVDLWSNPGDLVLSPFAGIGSEGYQSVKMGRRFLGFELKRSYFDRACRFLTDAASTKQMALFGDALPMAAGGDAE
jgi:DNA modification methylase